MIKELRKTKFNCCKIFQRLIFQNVKNWTFQKFNLSCNTKIDLKKIILISVNTVWTSRRMNGSAWSKKMIMSMCSHLGFQTSSQFLNLVWISPRTVSHISKLAKVKKNWPTNRPRTHFPLERMVYLRRRRRLPSYQLNFR